MVRKGWTQIDVLEGAQIIRGHRPPSVQWPSAPQEIPKRSVEPIQV